MEIFSIDFLILSYPVSPGCYLGFKSHRNKSFFHLNIFCFKIKSSPEFDCYDRKKFIFHQTIIQCRIIFEIIPTC